MKRNPKSKRIHDSESGKFLPESVADGLVPFGYEDDEDNSGFGWLLLILAVIVLGYAYTQGLLFF